MHVDAEGCRRGVIGKPPLLGTYVRHAQSKPAQLAWDWHRQIAGRREFREILVEEAVIAVIAGAAFRATAKQIAGQDRIVHWPPPCMKAILPQQPQLENR